MRIKIVATLIVVVLIVSTPFQALGQGTVPKEADIQKLKEEIQRRESLERDETIPPDLKEKNREYLVARQAQLRTLLQAKIAALQKYQTTLGPDLTPEERQLIDGSMQAIETELQSLGQNAQRSLPSAAAALNAPAALERPVSSPRLGLASPPPTLSQPSDQPPPSPPPVVTTSTPVAESANASSQTPSPQTPPDCSLFKDHPKTFSLYDKYVCDLARIIKDNKTNNRPLFNLRGPEFFNLSVLFMAKKLRTAYIIEAEEARVDKQVGGGSSNAGSTSLVVKGGTPAILGFAVENGALEQSRSGTTITFRGNPVGVIKALANKGFVEGYDEDSPATRFLRKASFAFSFDASRGQDPGTFTADRQQLSSYSARYEIYNKRDPRDRSYKKDWEDFLVNRAQTFVRDFARMRDALTEDVTGRPLALKDPALRDWFEKTIQALTTTALGNMETALNERLNELPLTDFSAETASSLEGFAREFGVYLEGRDRMLDRVAKGGIVTFEYTNNRQVNAPNLSHFMFIAETSFGGKVDLTANASLTIFDNLPQGVKMNRLRDFQFATQLDAPFNVQGVGKFVLSFAGKYERLKEDAMTSAGTVMMGTKGDIAIGQLKLTVPAKFGIKLPISVSFANRTELIKERDVRGNIGITFDFDSIFARFKK